MRPYGIPRVHNIESPDCGDLIEFGLKSSRGHLRGKGGDFHGPVRSSADKRAIRRLFKQKARRAARAEIARLLKNHHEEE